MKTVLYFLLSTILLLACNKTHVDPNVSLELKELSEPLFSMDYGNGIDYQSIKSNPLTLLSSGDLIVSSIQENSTIDKLQITKLNSAGNLIWQKNFDQGYNFKSGNCFETSNGQLIALGASIKQNNWTNSSVFIAKLNGLNGDTLWTREYGNNYVDRGVIGYEDATQNYWIVDFSHNDSKVTLLKIGNNGDSLTSIINTDLVSTYRDAMVSKNKKIILTGESGVFTSSKQPVYICSYTNGIKDFSNNIELDNFDAIRVTDICETSDGNYVVSGECYNFSNTQVRNGFLLKVSQTGQKIWEKIIGGFNNWGIYSCVEKTADVFYIGAGYTISSYIIV